MKVKMKNDAGLVREVSTGLSWTGFFFTGFTMMFRGMIGKGLVYMIVIYTLQTIIIVTNGLMSFAQTQRESSAVSMVWFFLGSIPNVIFLFKLNKWTARHWLDRGYKPTGPGWDVWGPKIGIEAASESKLNQPEKM